MKLSIKQLESYIANLITTDKISNKDFNVTRDNIVGLLDKVGKIVALDTNFQDKLPELDGEFLRFGRTVEEYHEDLTMPEDFDRQGSGALTYKESSYRPVFYSYAIKRQKIAISIPYGDVEKAVHDAEEFARVIAMKHKKLSDSEEILKYQLKKELIGKVIQLAIDEMSNANPVFDASQTYDVNMCVKKDESNNTEHGIIVKKIEKDAGLKDWNDAVNQGYIIVLNLVEELAKPIDTATGESFIESVKNIVETASEDNEGNSLNGNTLGTSDTLKMYVQHKILGNLDVQTLAGAFQEKRLALPLEVKSIKDFGSISKQYYAVVIDTRGVKLHPNYRAMRTNENGDGDFLNIFLHLGFTPYASRNVFIHVYKQPDELTKKVTEIKKVAKSK